MDTNVNVIKCNTKDISPEEILAQGNFFSGSIYNDVEKKSWTAFNLVNKEKMSYILSEINFSEGVEIEIFSYVKYPKDVQRQDFREQFNKI